MEHTVETLLSMADSYADAECSDYLTGEASSLWHRENLRKALTEALAKRETSDFQKWSVLAFRALDDAGRVLMTVKPECSTESDNLSVLTETIKELMYQALTLNGVLSRKDMDRKFHFGKLDSDALLAAQPAVKESLSTQTAQPASHSFGCHANAFGPCTCKAAQPGQVPLTDDQIQEIYISEYNKGHHGRDFENLFARGIERAHHIGITK